MKKVLKLLLVQKKYNEQAFKDCIRLSQSCDKKFQNVFKRDSKKYKEMVEELDKAIKILNEVPCVEADVCPSCGRSNDEHKHGCKEYYTGR